MSLVRLVLANLWAKKSRSIGIAFAIGIAVMTVVTLTVVSSGLENAAAAVLTIGKSDFTVAQNGVSDILFSSIDDGQLHNVGSTKGVANAVGVLLETEKINAGQSAKNFEYSRQYPRLIIFKHSPRFAQWGAAIDCNGRQT